MEEKVNILESDFTPMERGIILQEFNAVSLKTGIVTMVKRCIAKELESREAESNNKSTKEVSKLKDFTEFTSRNLIRTDSRSDYVALADLYDFYEKDLKSRGLVRSIMTKQEFRINMEELDYNYSKARGNKNVFRYVKFAEQETEEDWEL